MKSGFIDDKDLGRVEIRVNPRARNITMRAREDGLRVTVPPYASLADVERAIDSCRARLLEARRRAAAPALGFGYRIDAPLFRLTIEPGMKRQFTIRWDAGGATVFCPPDADFGREATQLTLRRAVERAIKRQAEVVLPPRLEALSRRHGLPYAKARVTAARTKWGSCSSGKTISLSCFLLLLPEHLIDFVMLHELSHTREMNHGQGFYKLLNSLTGNRELQLRKELRGYHPKIG